MSEQQTEKNFPCPNCGEPISIILDLLVNSQRYIEDCEVCCRPMDVCYSIREGHVTQFEARRGD